MKGYATLQNVRDAWDHALASGSWGSPTISSSKKRLPIFKAHVASPTHQPRNAVRLSEWLSSSDRHGAQPVKREEGKELSQLFEYVAVI